MTAVVRMTMLDLRIAATNGRQLLLLVVVVAGMGFVVDDPLAVVAMGGIYAALAASYPFVVVDRDDLDTLYGVLPLTRTAVVVGHYAAAVAAFLVAIGAGTAAALTAAQARSIRVDVTMLGGLLAWSWMMFAMVVAMQFPMFVRLGYPRAKLVANLPLWVLLGAAFTVFQRVPAPDTLALVWLLAGLTMATAVLAASVAVSVRIDPRRVRAPMGG